jgi:hypothetical protein
LIEPFNIGSDQWVTASHILGLHGFLNALELP